MTNKEIAQSFLQLAGLGNVKEAFDKYVSEDFIHHNQYFKGDRRSLLIAMTEAHTQQPNKSVDTKNTFEEGETVITHSLVSNEKMEIAVVHIFRFCDGKICELWDLGQEIAKNSPNEHGLF